MFGPIVFNEPNNRKVVEVAVASGLIVHQADASAGGVRLEGLQLDPPPHGASQIGDGPKRVVVSGVGRREVVENRADGRARPTLASGKRIVVGERLLVSGNERLKVANLMRRTSHLAKRRQSAGYRQRHIESWLRLGRVPGRGKRLETLQIPEISSVA